MARLRITAARTAMSAQRRSLRRSTADLGSVDLTPAARSSSTARRRRPARPRPRASRPVHDHVEARALGVQRGRLDAVVEREPGDVHGVHTVFAQQALELGALEPRVALEVARLALVDDRVDLPESTPGCSAAPAVSCTQCTGHGPPLSANDPWSAGCQSRVATTNGELAASRLIGSTTASPSVPPALRRGRSRSGRRSRAERPCLANIVSAWPLARDSTTELDPPRPAVGRGCARDRRAGAHRRRRARAALPSGGELHAVFTKRRDDLRRHPGEISFPGGRYDEGERDLLATALREAEEEIGLPADAVEVARGAAADPDDRHRLRRVPVRGDDRGRAARGRPAPARSPRCSSCRCRTCSPATPAAASCAAGFRSGPTPTWSTTT